MTARKSSFQAWLAGRSAPAAPSVTPAAPQRPEELALAVAGLVRAINGHPALATSSSSSGRIVLFQSHAGTPAGRGGRWLLVRHSTVTTAEVLTALKSTRSAFTACSSVSLKAEPAVLHVQCRNMESAAWLLKLAQRAGFRESGLVLFDSSKLMLAVRTASDSLELPVALVQPDECMRLLVTPAYLEHVVQVANDKLEANAGRVAGLHSAIVGAAAGVAECSDPASDAAGAWRDPGGEKGHSAATMARSAGSGALRMEPPEITRDAGVAHGASCGDRQQRELHEQQWQQGGRQQHQWQPQPQPQPQRRRQQRQPCVQEEEAGSERPAARRTAADDEQASTFERHVPGEAERQQARMRQEREERRARDRRDRDQAQAAANEEAAELYVTKATESESAEVAVKMLRKAVSLRPFRLQFRRLLYQARCRLAREQREERRAQARQEHEERRSRAQAQAAANEEAAELCVTKATESESAEVAVKLLRKAVSLRPFRLQFRRLLYQARCRLAVEMVSSATANWWCACGGTYGFLGAMGSLVVFAALWWVTLRAVLLPRMLRSLWFNQKCPPVVRVVPQEQQNMPRKLAVRLPLCVVGDALEKGMGLALLEATYGDAPRRWPLLAALSTASAALLALTLLLALALPPPLFCWLADWRPTKARAVCAWTVVADRACTMGNAFLSVMFGVLDFLKSSLDMLLDDDEVSEDNRVPQHHGQRARREPRQSSHREHNQTTGGSSHRRQASYEQHHQHQQWQQQQRQQQPRKQQQQHRASGTASVKQRAMWLPPGEIRRVLLASDHYEALGVSLAAQGSEVKKAFHKLALKLQCVLLL